MEAIKAPLRSTPFDFDERELKIYEALKEIETFRFIDLQDFNEECVSLPIDKIVASMIMETDRIRFCNT